MLFRSSPSAPTAPTPPPLSLLPPTPGAGLPGIPRGGFVFCKGWPSSRIPDLLPGHRARADVFRPLALSRMAPLLPSFPFAPAPSLSSPLFPRVARGPPALRSALGRGRHREAASRRPRHEAACRAGPTARARLASMMSTSSLRSLLSLLPELAPAPRERHRHRMRRPSHPPGSRPPDPSFSLASRRLSFFSPLRARGLARRHGEMVDPRPGARALLFSPAGSRPPHRPRGEASAKSFAVSWDLPSRPCGNRPSSSR